MAAEGLWGNSGQYFPTIFLWKSVRRWSHKNNALYSTPYENPTPQLSPKLFRTVKVNTHVAQRALFSPAFTERMGSQKPVSLQQSPAGLHTAGPQRPISMSTRSEGERAAGLSDFPSQDFRSEMFESRLFLMWINPFRLQSPDITMQDLHPGCSERSKQPMCVARLHSS